MSIETFSPLPLTTFGTWLTLLDPSDVPPGMSPDCADVEFFPGGVRTRPGLVSQFAPLAGTPNVNALKTYITTNLVQRLLVLDSLGTIYKETSPGTLGVLIAGLQPNLLFASTTHFGREYMAFSDGLVGADLPRQFDDTFFDRVSQVGPGEGPALADSTLTGNISRGARVRRRVRHAPGILDRALARRQLDRSGLQAGCGDEYSHRPGKRGAAIARIHGRGRRELLPRPRLDGD